MKKHLIWLALLVPFVFFYGVFALWSGSFIAHHWLNDVKVGWLMCSIISEVIVFVLIGIWYEDL